LFSKYFRLRFLLVKTQCII